MIFHWNWNPCFLADYSQFSGVRVWIEWTSPYPSLLSSACSKPVEDLASRRWHTVNSIIGWLEAQFFSIFMMPFLAVTNATHHTCESNGVAWKLRKSLGIKETVNSSWGLSFSFLYASGMGATRWRCWLFLFVVSKESFFLRFTSDEAITDHQQHLLLIVDCWWFFLFFLVLLFNLLVLHSRSICLRAIPVLGNGHHFFVIFNKLWWKQNILLCSSHLPPAFLKTDVYHKRAVSSKSCLRAKNGGVWGMTAPIVVVYFVLYFYEKASFGHRLSRS